MFLVIQLLAIRYLTIYFKTLGYILEIINYANSVVNHMVFAKSFHQVPISTIWCASYFDFELPLRLENEQPYCKMYFRGFICMI